MAKPKITKSMKVRRQFVLVSILIGLALIVPIRVLWGMRAGVLDQINTVVTEQSASRSRVQQAREANAKQIEFFQVLERLNKAMPSSIDLPTIIDDLSILAGELNVNINSTKATEPIGAAGVGGGGNTSAPQAGQLVAPPASGGGVDGANPSGAGSTAGISVAIIETIVTGDSEDLFEFMRQLRERPRVYLVEASAFTWGTTGSETTATTSLRIFAYAWDSPYKAPESIVQPDVDVPETADTQEPGEATEITTPDEEEVFSDGELLEPVGEPVELSPDEQNIVPQIVIGSSCAGVGAEGYRGVSRDGEKARCTPDGNGGATWVAEEW